MNVERAGINVVSGRSRLLPAARRRARDISGWYVLFFQAADAAATLAAMWLAVEVRRRLPFGPVLDGEGWASPQIYLVALVLSVIVYVTLGVYRIENLRSVADELRSVLRATGVGITLLAGLLYFTERGLSRWLFIYYGVIKLSLVITARLIARASCKALDWHLTPSRRVLIVGAGPMARSVAEHLTGAGGRQFQVVGFVGDTREPADSTGGIPVLGTLDQADSLARTLHIDELLVALPLGESHVLPGLMAATQNLPLQVTVIPDYFDLAYLYARSDEVAGIPVIRLKAPVLSARQRAIKRVFDLFIAGGLLIASAPLLLLAAAAIKLDSQGTILYRQKRIGEGGRPFSMYKLRTMTMDAEREEAKLIESSGGLLQFNKRPDDPRLTRVGALLRRWSIDELPQLLNVIIGDLSLVGPRPELPSLVERYSAWQRKRFSVPQGVTGWWQVNGRPQSIDQKVELDLIYVRNYSLWLDLWILLKTLSAVIRRDGAY